MKKRTLSILMLFTLLIFASCERPQDDPGTDGRWDIRISSPSEGATITGSSFTIETAVGRDVGAVGVTINGEYAGYESEYPFSITVESYKLRTGENTVTVESYYDGWDGHERSTGEFDTIKVYK